MSSLQNLHFARPLGLFSNHTCFLSTRFMALEAPTRSKTATTRQNTTTTRTQGVERRDAARILRSWLVFCVAGYVFFFYLKEKKNPVGIGPALCYQLRVAEQLLFPVRSW